eukprot:5383083-Amphidinium_carterae.1
MPVELQAAALRTLCRVIANHEGHGEHLITLLRPHKVCKVSSDPSRLVASHSLQKALGFGIL